MKTMNMTRMQMCCCCCSMHTMRNDKENFNQHIINIYKVYKKYEDNSFPDSIDFRAAA